MAQTKTITGVVVDATGEPVIGASVLEVGTTNGTITDVDGNFTIQVPVGAKLDVSYIGYKTQQIVVGVPNTYKVILKEDAEMLDEVVVTGYGMSQKRSLMTNSISKLDEIQCGMGRTGFMYAWQRFGVKPDIMTSAKAVGCGVPVGGFLMTERVAQNSLTSGDHGTTYGGNPLACAAISKVMDLFDELKILENVQESGAYLYEKLEYFAQKQQGITAHRGIGLLQGLEFDKPVGEIINKAVDKGLLLINAGTNVIRFIPPLIVTKNEVDAMMEILESCIYTA